MPLLPFLGFSIHVAGEVLLGLSVYFVHQRVAREKKIDRSVLAEFHRERKLALAGIILIVVGYLLEVPSNWG